MNNESNVKTKYWKDASYWRAITCLDVQVNRITWFCGNCHKPVGRKDTVCRHCGTEILEEI